MPDDTDTDAGAAYLAALKQIQGSGAAAAAATGLELAHPTQSGNGSAAVARPAATEKRKSPRYKCTGSARMQRSGSETSIWATFTDISMHGCYVECAVPFPHGASLDLKLEANGYHVETMGEVRVSYPGLGMGISFLRMSDSDRARLRELVGSISPRSVIVGPRVALQSMPVRDFPAAANAGAAVQAMRQFFEDRQMMGRDDFLRILRKSQL